MQKGANAKKEAKSLSIDIMPFAYVLLKCEPGYENIIVDELKSLPEVVSTDKILGSPFDIIVKVEAISESSVRKTINQRIRSIEKIKATNTMMIVTSLRGNS